MNIAIIFVDMATATVVCSLRKVERVSSVSSVNNDHYDDCDANQARLRQFTEQAYETFRLEVESFVGWKCLDEYEYTPFWRYVDHLDKKHATDSTVKWLKALREHGLEKEHGILIFDGEVEHALTPNCRIFVLSDGRLLWYKGGFFAGLSENNLPKLVCGDTSVIYDVFDRYKDYSLRRAGSSFRNPSIILLQSFSRLIDQTIDIRKRDIGRQITISNMMKVIIDTHSE